MSSLKLQEWCMDLGVLLPLTRELIVYVSIALNNCCSTEHWNRMTAVAKVIRYSLSTTVTETQQHQHCPVSSSLKQYQAVSCSIKECQAVSSGIRQ